MYPCFSCLVAHCVFWLLATPLVTDARYSVRVWFHWSDFSRVHHFPCRGMSVGLLVRSDGAVVVGVATTPLFYFI